MNGMVVAGGGGGANRASSGERTAIVGGQGQEQLGQGQGSGYRVQRLHSTQLKRPEPLCILGCCGRGKLMIMWSKSDALSPTVDATVFANSSQLNAADNSSVSPRYSAAGATSAHESAANSTQADDLPPPAADDLDLQCAGGERLGRIQFSLSYDFHRSTLILKILRAVELAAKDITGTSDPYVKVMLLPDKKNKLLTNIKRRNLNPRWNEVFSFEGFPYSKLMSRTLYLQVLDYDRFSRDDPIGEVCLPLSDINLKTEQTMWKTLQPCKGHTGKLGELLISLCYQPTAECITVIVQEARGLKAKDINGLSDPYVKIWLLRDGKRTEKRKSAVIEKSLNPVFNETCMFILPYEHIRSTSLEVSVMDYDRLGRNERIGQVLLGSKSGPMEVKHWNEMFAKTRQSVTQWHVLKDFG